MLVNKFLSEFLELSAALQLLVLAFACLGTLCGLIFVIDGWRAHQSIGDKPSRFGLLRSPKFSGLTYVVGAGILPILADILRTVNSEAQIQSGLAIATYSLFVSISAIIGVICFTLYAFAVSYNHLRVYFPAMSCWSLGIRALPFVSIALQRGNQAFLDEIDMFAEIDDLIARVLKQREGSMAFLAGAFDRLIRNNSDEIYGVEEFRSFAEQYLGIFLRFFFDHQYSLDGCRASLYVAGDSENNVGENGDTPLLFVCGYGPPGCLHAGRSLSLNNSLAGYAIKHPGDVYIYSEDISSKPVLPFEPRNKTSKYGSVIVCAIQPLEVSNQRTPDPRLVLCIDLVKDNFDMFNKQKGFATKIISYFSIFIATASSSMRVGDDDLFNSCRGPRRS